MVLEPRNQRGKERVGLMLKIVASLLICGVHSTYVLEPTVWEPSICAQLGTIDWNAAFTCFNRPTSDSAAALACLDLPPPASTCLKQLEEDRDVGRNAKRNEERSELSLRNEESSELRNEKRNEERNEERNEAHSEERK